MKIFVGSSTESLDELNEVSSWIENEDVSIVSWRDPDLFLPGQNTYSRLLEIARSVDAAIFIFGEDDKVWYRSDALKQPRDNVILEYGLFCGILGVENAIVCRKDAAKGPTDLAGMIVVDISERCKHEAQRKLFAWRDQRQRAIQRSSPIRLEEGLIVLLEKATTGFTRDLSERIQREFAAQLPRLNLSILDSTDEERIQVGDLEDAINRHPEVIVLTPSPDSEQLIPGIITALEQGIPVITIDDQFNPKRFIEEGWLPPVNIACDHAEGGKHAARVILEHLKHQGNVAVISGPKTSSSSQIRKLAFIDKVLSASPTMSIVSVKETNWNPEVGRQRMEEILRECEDVNAVFCCNDRLALGAIKAVEEAGREPNNMPIIVGHDGTSEGLAAVKSGKMHATITQHMDQLAKITVSELRRVLPDKSAYIRKHAFTRWVGASVITREDLIL